MSHVHLLLGPVGAGKSTFATKLCKDHRAVALDLDEWMATLFPPNRPDADHNISASERVELYQARAARCVDQIWSVAQRLLAVGTPVVLEVGLIVQHERWPFYERLHQQGHPLTVYVLDAERETRRQRVHNRNIEQGPTYSMQVSPTIFDLASDLWEPPSESELRGKNVQHINTDR